ncbi:hypothetical protein GCM10009665_53150 [Kitasatospora nipponensis]|uniref:Transferase family protein n=1 Tax=Kitasatospora nipponensis TaxID=258049 RepID=A0ABP4HBJ1_9ACTN
MSEADGTLSAAGVRAVRTVRAGTASGQVVRCDLSDVMLADLPVSVVFFYPHALDEERLLDGLARALARVPLFAGRLRTVEGELQIVCDDAGVPVTLADATETLAGAMGRMTLTASGFVDHVQAAAARTGDLPLFTVRLSRLTDGGTALGCSWHHAVGDVQTFALFMRGWSAEVEGTEAPGVHLVADREAFLEAALPASDSGRPGFRLPEPAEAALLAQEVASAGRANRTVQVYFDAPELDRMREHFSAVAGRWLSSNDALCAHVLGAIRQLDDPADAEERELTVPVNVRGFLGLPAGALGNLLGEIQLPCPPGQGPEHLAVRLREAIETFPQSQLSLRSSRAFLARVGRDRLRECVPLGFNPARKTFTFSNWSRFGVYDVAFEGHRPVAFSPANIVQLPWVSWLVEGFDGRGRLFTVVLPARLAGRLRTPAGQAALHPFREPQDVLPALAGELRKLA